jgi:hypothetical protein
MHFRRNALIRNSLFVRMMLMVRRPVSYVLSMLPTARARLAGKSLFQNRNNEIVTSLRIGFSCQP